MLLRQIDMFAAGILRAMGLQSEETAQLDENLDWAMQEHTGNSSRAG